MARQHDYRLLAVFFVSLCLCGSTADAHPVPRSNHDRTIVVRLAPDAGGGRVMVTVEYRLEVDELTVVLEDMIPFKDEVDYSKYRNKPKEFYAEFTRLYAPILANNLTATVDGKAVVLECVKRGHRLDDEEGKPLGHLRCDFVFQATFAAPPGTTWIRADRERSAVNVGPPRHAPLSTMSGWKCRNDSAFQTPVPSTSSHTSQKRPGRQKTRRR